MAKRTEAEFKEHQAYMNKRRKIIHEFPEYVNESSLSRVRQHMLDHDTAIKERHVKTIGRIPN